MKIIVNREWLKKAIEEDFLMAVKIIFLFTNNIKKTEELVKRVFVSLMNEKEFESERHFLSWIIKESVKFGKDSKAEAGEKVFYLDKKKRLALYLNLYEGFSEIEISGLMHISESAVESKIEEAFLDIGYDRKMAERELKEVFSKLYVSEKLKADLNMLIDSNAAKEIAKERILKKERQRKRNLIVSLILIAACILTGSGVIGGGNKKEIEILKGVLSKESAEARLENVIYDEGIIKGNIKVTDKDEFRYDENFDYLTELKDKYEFTWVYGDNEKPLIKTSEKCTVDTFVKEYEVEFSLKIEDKGLLKIKTENFENSFEIDIKG